MLNVRTLLPLAPGARMIFVGDIHGCSEEFDQLIAKVKYQQGHDVLILVGDLVNKGYDSVGVIERAIQLGAIGVLGNHDASLISRFDRIREGEIDPSVPPHTLDPMTQTAEKLSRKCYKYLTELPHILLVPQFDVIVAHAGINPKTALGEQNLWELLHMRRILPNGRVIDAQSGGDLWATKWKGPRTVIFGHDARTGLQIHPFAIGLDTGCCYGGDLTAYVLPSKEFIKVPGSKRGVSKKPPTASPETQIGFSPSVEISTPQPQPAPQPTSSNSVMQQLMAAAPSAAVSSNSNSAQRTHTPSTSAIAAAGGANAAATEALKSMLFGKNASPVPPAHPQPDGPTFPSVPPSAVGTSNTQSPMPEGSHAPPLPRSAAKAIGTAAVPPAAAQPVKLVPSSQVSGSTVERSAKPSSSAVVNGSAGSAATQPNVPLPPQPKPVAPAPVAPQPTPAPSATPAAVKAAATPAAPAAATSNGASSDSTTVVALRRHLFASAAQVAGSISGSNGAVAAAVVELLCGGPMEDHRQQLLDDKGIAVDVWALLISNLARHVTDPKCVSFVANEALLWVQDVAASKPEVLDALDRKALEAAIMVTSAATRSVVKSTLIAVRK